MTKDQLRAELERQAQRYQDIYGGEIVTYAAQPKPDRKPWKKRPTVQDEVFASEVRKIADRKAKTVADNSQED
ncbi:beta-ketoadipyl CoA thiolase [Pseudomonas oryzihabitans]|nr:beta-ketoadipyl CoA thiolase [Pseudomonas psychrotolerans]